jgi:hypothetical protein
VSDANLFFISSLCYNNLRFTAVVKETNLDISEAGCSLQSHTNLTNTELFILALLCSIFLTLSTGQVLAIVQMNL